MAYVIVAARNDDQRTIALSSHRTLRAAQREWDKKRGDRSGLYKFSGILTPDGLRDYFGKPMHPCGLGYVVCTMGVKR